MLNVQSNLSEHTAPQRTFEPDTYTRNGPMRCARSLSIQLREPYARRPPDPNRADRPLRTRDVQSRGVAYTRTVAQDGLTTCLTVYHAGLAVMCYKHPRQREQQMHTKEKGSPTSRADAGIAFRHTSQMWLGLYITIFDSMGGGGFPSLYCAYEVTTAFPCWEEGG